MTEAAVVALIAVGGVVVTAIAQLITTRVVVRGDLQRIVHQLRAEATERRRDTKRERLVDALSDCLSLSDPEVHARPDYQSLVRQIHRIQLILDTTVPEELELAHSLNALGKAVGVYRGLQQSGEPLAPLSRAQAPIFDAQARLVTISQGYLARLDAGPGAGLVPPGQGPR